MIRFFGDNRPFALFFLPLILLGFHLTYRLTFFTIGPLDIEFGWWGNARLEQGSSNIYAEICAATWVLMNAIALNYTFNSAEFNEKNTYLPALNFVVFSALFMNFYELNGFHLASSMIILSINQFLKLNQNQTGTLRIFNAALFIAIAATVYPPFVLLIPLGILCYLIFRPFQMREFYFYLLGSAIPFSYLISFSYLYNTQSPSFAYTWNPFIVNFSLSHSINSAIVFCLFVVSLIGVRHKLSNAGNRMKKEIQLVNLIGLGIFFSLLFCAFLGEPSMKIEYFIVPLSILFSFPLLSKRFSFPSSLLFYLFLIYGLLKFTFLNSLL